MSEYDENEPDMIIPGINDNAASAVATATADGDDEAPFDPLAAAAEIAIPDFTPEFTLDELDRARFRDVPPGHHVLRVLSASPSGDPRLIESWVKHPNGTVERSDYFSQSVRVVFCMPGDEKCTVSTFLDMPPGTPKEQHSYFHGFGKQDWAKSGKPGEGGQGFRLFLQFVGRLGFKQDENKKFPREAFYAPNWLFYPGTKVPRLIGCEVVPGRQRPAKVGRDGKMFTPRIYNEIRKFSFTEVPPPPEAIVGGPETPAAQPAPAPAEEASPAPAPAAAGNGKGRRRAPVGV